MTNAYNGRTTWIVGLSCVVTVVVLAAPVASTVASSWDEWPGMRMCHGVISKGVHEPKALPCRTGGQLPRRPLSGQGVSGGESYRIKDWKRWLCGESAGGGTCTRHGIGSPETVGWQVGVRSSALTSRSNSTAVRELRAKSCGKVTADYPDVEGGSGLELIRVRGLSCRNARRVVRWCIRRYHVKGWSARYDEELFGHLRRGRRHIAFKGIAGGGPHCMPDPFSRSRLDFSRIPTRPSIRKLKIETSQARVATIRICAARGAIRIVIRELLTGSEKKNPVVLGESSDLFTRKQRKRCQRYRLTWEEFEQVRGVGVHRIELRVIDRTGRASKARRHSYRVTH